MLSQWGYRDICKSTSNLLLQEEASLEEVPASSLEEVPAGNRINFEGLAFASKAILRKKTFGCSGQPPSSTPSTE